MHGRNNGGEESYSSKTLLWAGINAFSVFRKRCCCAPPDKTLADFERFKKRMKTSRAGSSEIVNTPLILIAGITWASVGVLLLTMAGSWLARLHSIHLVLFAGVGIALGLLVHHWGFLRIVDKNLNRISTMDRQRSLFSFIPWKSYLLIFLMMTIGFLLRHSRLPKQYLSIGYLCMGLALILSSVRYFRVFAGEKKRKKA
jgi:hypothetical protein